MKILDAPSVRADTAVWYDKSEVVRSPVARVWHPAVEKKMQSVAAGTLLGRVTEPFGKNLHEARAPFAGEVLYVVGTPPVKEGEPVAFVARVADPEPVPSP